MPTLEQVFSQAKNSFSASHILIGFDKCDRLHGHNYSVTVHLKYNQIAPKSLIDFRIVNTAIKHELQILNQKILLPEKSSHIQIESTLKGKNWQVVVDNKKYSFPKQDVIILEGIEQTTTENIAFYLHQRLNAWLRQNYPNLVKTLEIKIAENLGNKAKYSSPI